MSSLLWTAEFLEGASPQDTPNGIQYHPIKAIRVSGTTPPPIRPSTPPPPPHHPATHPAWYHPTTHTQPPNPPTRPATRPTHHPATDPPPTPPLNQVVVAPQNLHKKPYTGTYPHCAKCQYHHATNTPCRHCTGCGRKGHWVQHWRMEPNQAVNNAVLALPPPNNPNQNNGGCYNCGEIGHFSKNCSKKVQPAVQAPRGRAFAIGAPAARQDPNVVTRTFLIHDFYASILFDTGADQSFISTDFACQLNHVEEPLDSPYIIKVANGKHNTS
ncbi:hypothetical protein E3N88_22409 [Mikania micrantha]|uniref:CCHC-type domain-containing protein n=1 Tax=Mikania micrantha TaxID=192012 RepID=A0A5N6NCX4_9ASTR|nr:hypothetical protein E3N88_22409 [Mikania micrantha]